MVFFVDRASIQLSEIEEYNPERVIRFQPDRLCVVVCEPTDLLVTGFVWPMVEDQFSRYTQNADGLAPDGSQAMISNDQFDRKPTTKVVVTLQNNIILGSFRVVAGYDGDSQQQPGIDAMVLMRRLKGWPEAAQPFGEFGRFVVHPKLKKQDSQIVLRRLYATAMEQAESAGFRDNVFVILAQHVLRFVAGAGIDVEEYGDAILNEGNPEADQAFNTFPRYWRPQMFPEYRIADHEPESPGLYRYFPKMRPVDFDR